MKVFLFIILVTLVGCHIQDNMVFRPTEDPESLEFDFSFDANWEELEFAVSKRKSLNVLHFKSKDPKGVMVYYHGNAGSLKTWGYVAPYVLKYNYDLIIYDYRGYGKSDGKTTSEKQWYKDGQVVYDSVKRLYPEENIIVYGRSIGTGLAAKIAADNNPAKLMLETPYCNFPKLVKELMPKAPLFLLTYQIPTDEYLMNVKCPIYLFHGTKDELIDYVHSECLKDQKESIKLYTIPEGGHNNLSEFEEFELAIKETMNE